MQTATATARSRHVETWTCPHCRERIPARWEYCPICTSAPPDSEFSPLEIFAGLVVLPILVGLVLSGLFFFLVLLVEAIR